MLPVERSYRGRKLEVAKFPTSARVESENKSFSAFSVRRFLLCLSNIVHSCSKFCVDVFRREDQSEVDRRSPTYFTFKPLRHQTWISSTFDPFSHSY